MASCILILTVYSHRYGEQVENYLEVYLRTPGLPKEDVAKALLARGNARKLAGERLLAKAQQGELCVATRSAVDQSHANRALLRQDFQAVAKLDPSNRDLQAYLRRGNMVSS